MKHMSLLFLAKRKEKRRWKKEKKKLLNAFEIGRRYEMLSKRFTCATSIRLLRHRYYDWT